MHKDKVACFVAGLILWTMWIALILLAIIAFLNLTRR